MDELWFHQARLFASSVRREIRKLTKAIELERGEWMVENHHRRLASLTQGLQLHLDRRKEIR
jgi:hypothetical protein